MDQRGLQLEAIEKEVKTNSKLVAGKEDIGILLKEYEQNPSFLNGIQYLTSHYANIRKIRGDGNCFYRGFLFAFVERFYQQEQVLQDFLDRIKQTRTELVQVGYEDSTLEIFYDTLVEYVQNLKNVQLADIEHYFSDENGESNYLVWYLRMVTAGYLKMNEERFMPFVDGLYPGKTMELFCREQVEPMDKECEEVQVIALLDSLQVRTKIEYLDGHSKSNESLRHYTYPQEDDTNDPKITLLYRPGHYDVIYQK